MLASSVDSTRFFAPHWLCWTVLGIVPSNVKHRRLYLVYSVLVHIILFVGYALNLAMSLFRHTTIAETLKSLSASVVCFASCWKYVIYATKLSKVREVERILKELDDRVHSLEERSYYQHIRRTVRYIAYTFLGVYMSVATSAGLNLVFKEERDLLFPGWFPFDWHNSTLYYCLAIVYQIAGASYQTTQNYVNDCFPPTALWLLAGHVDLLGLRLSRIGYAEQSQAENEAELQRCVVDQENLYKLLDALQDIISLSMLIQLLVTAFNICLSLGSLVFFIDAPLDRLYYFTFLITMLLQIFPACYCGSNVSLRFAQLPRHVYTSNWVFQSQSYKKHMMIFTERSLTSSTAMAGKVVKIHLDTFFATCRAAYSLFAILMRFKN